jgi:hypothetical protein
MLAFSTNVKKNTCQLQDHLKTTGMGLGLLRLQLDTGMTEEARTTLHSLQNDLQLLLHGVEEIEKPRAKPLPGLIGDRWRASDATRRERRKSRPTMVRAAKELGTALLDPKPPSR